MTVVLVILGAALGAPARYLTDWLIQGRHGSVFPWGTLAVNVSGSALLGFLVALAAPGAAGSIAGIAFCGAFTTYSMFGFETVRLSDQRAFLLAALNVVVSITAALGAAYVGLALARAII
jgi:fluoride exporter